MPIYHDHTGNHLSCISTYFCVANCRGGGGGVKLQILEKLHHYFNLLDHPPNYEIGTGLFEEPPTISNTKALQLLFDLYFLENTMKKDLENTRKNMEFYIKLSVDTLYKNLLPPPPPIYYQPPPLPPQSTHILKNSTHPKLLQPPNNRIVPLNHPPPPPPPTMRYGRVTEDITPIP